MPKTALGIISGVITTISSLINVLESDTTHRIWMLLLSTTENTNISHDIILLLAFVGIFAFPTWLIYKLFDRRKYPRIKRIQTYLFFPTGTPDEDKTLEYHKKKLHHRLIVNLKTKPEKAYYMPSGSYPCKLVERHTDLWVSENDPTPLDDNFTQRWCDSKQYTLVRQTAERDDLLESSPDT